MSCIWGAEWEEIAHLQGGAFAGLPSSLAGESIDPDLEFIPVLASTATAAAADTGTQLLGPLS